MKANRVFSTGLTQIIRLKNKPQYQSYQSGHLKVVKSLQEKGQFIYEDLKFMTSGLGVYQPTETSSSLFMLKHLPKFTDQSILEMGTGCGIIAVAMAKLGNIVTAADICENAVNVARNNAELNFVDMTVLKSDLFENIESQKFDHIIFNSPFMDKEVHFMEERALCDPDSRLVRKFLKCAVSFLKPDGKIYLSTSNIANLNVIRQTMKKNNLTGDIVGKEIDAETGVIRFLLSIHIV